MDSLDWMTIREVKRKKGVIGKRWMNRMTIFIRLKERRKVTERKWMNGMTT